MNSFLFQLNVPDIDVITPPVYPLNHSRSPSINDHRLPDTNIEYFRPHDTSVSPPTSDNEIFSTPKQHHKINDAPSFTETQILVDNSPLRSQTSAFPQPKQQRKVDETQPLVATHVLSDRTPLTAQTSNISPPATQSPRISTKSHQWKSTSVPSLANTEIRLTPSSSMDVDTPRLDTSSIQYGLNPNTEKIKRTDSQSRMDETYNSFSTVSNLVQRNRSYTSTHGSLPDAEILQSNSSNLPKPATIDCKIRILNHFNHRLLIISFSSSWQVSRVKCYCSLSYASNFNPL